MDIVIVRAYRPGDAQGMFALDRECFAEPFRFSRPAMRRFAEAQGAISLVAIAEKGELAGFVVVHEEGRRGSRYGYVVTLDVAPEWRRSRLATRLMLEAERRLSSDGVGLMALHVHTGNEAAIRFYDREGYAPVGLEPGFYGAGLDAWVYSKVLLLCANADATRPKRRRGWRGPDGSVCRGW